MTIARRRSTLRGRLAAIALLLAGSGGATAERLPTVADFQLPPQDAAGWTVLAPSPDSRLIYVDDALGDDATGAAHAPADPEIGPDPRHPAGPVRAFRTLQAAAALQREDQPDWLLLRAGGVWYASLPTRRGRSAQERAVVTAWGEGPRPELRTGTHKGIATEQPVNLAVLGIRFWAHTRDSDGPYFSGYEGSSGMHFYTRAAPDPRQVRDVLIEDCVFRAYANNVFTGSAPNEPFVRLAIRRSIISGNYKTTGQGHSQGIYHVGSGHDSDLPSILLQENLFDHNGWRIQSVAGNNDPADGQATIFNHNTYFTAPRNVLFQRNLFLRPSSIGTKWTGAVGPLRDGRGIVIEDNLFAEGEVGISMGGNDPGGPLRFDGIAIRDNVFADIGRTRPTNRSLSWGLELIDWRSGTVRRNLFIHQRAPIGNSYAIKVSAPDQIATVAIEDNVVGNFRSGGSGIFLLGDGGNVDQVLLHGNTVQSPTDSPLVSLVPGGYLFSGANRYHSAAQPNRRFRVGGNLTDLAGWIAASGDAGASDAPIDFPAPQRDLEGYVAHLGLGSGFDAFLAAVHGQSRANWNPALTAGAINDWLRGGFGMPALHGDTLFADGFEP